MAQKFIRQHEPIRIPEKWYGQDRAFAIQLNRLFDEVYAKLGDLDQKIKELQPEEETVEEEET